MPDDDWPGRPPEPYDAATADRLIVAHLRRRGIDRATLTAAAAVYDDRGAIDPATWLREAAALDAWIDGFDTAHTFEG